MSTKSLHKIDQKEYLKKYLSGDKIKKKKKDKKHKSSSSSEKVKIIDDDINNFDTGPQIDEELLLTGDDAPQIVGEYIEEHPVENKVRKWKCISIKDETQDSDVGKMRSERTPDFSPPRRNVKNKRYSPPRPSGKHNSPPKKSKRDISPHRRRKSDDIAPDYRNKIKREYITPDKSPLRRGQIRERDFSTSRRHESESSATRDKRKYSTDLTPPKNKKYDRLNSMLRSDIDHSSGQTPPRRRRNYDQSPPRNGNRSRNQSPRYESSPDQSPPRKGRNQSTEQSPSRKRRNSDHSPPRRNKKSDQSPFQSSRYSYDQSPPRKKRSLIADPPTPRRNIEDSDQSPQRKGRHCSPTRKRRSSDQSPPRKSRNHSADQSPPRRRRNSDQSPPRRSKHFSPKEKKIDSPPISSRHDPAKHIKREKLSPDLSPRTPAPTVKPKAEKTLEGKKAGLQDAQALHTETLERRKQEDLFFEKMSSDVSGRNAEVQFRSTGRRSRKEDPEERKRREEHEEKKKQLYDRWGKGLKQIEDHKNRLLEQAYESSKPLARYENDEDLERHLKEQERPEDPMLEYMRQKRKEKEKQSGKPQIPRYEGPFPENRFGIRPGYRWDGVDRSNGYEKKYFSAQNKKRARQDEAYKYSVEDM